MIAQKNSSGLYEIHFSNVTGLYNPIVDYPEGQFSYETYTEYRITEDETFRFQYNNLWKNAIIGNDLCSHTYEGHWSIIQV